MTGPRPDGDGIERDQQHDGDDGHQRGEQQDFLADQELRAAEQAEQDAGGQRPSLLPDEGIVEQHEDQRRQEHDEERGMAEKVRHHVGREAVEKTADRRRERSFDVTTD